MKLFSTPPSAPSQGRYSGPTFYGLLLGLCGAVGAQENILILIGDDIGVDRVGIYSEHPNPGSTPTIDQLAQGGLLFRNAWAHPGCTPSRASLLTGRLPSRHGLGSFLAPGVPFGLPLEEVTIPEMLASGSGGAYSSFAVGKWHVAGSTDSMAHPLRQGFDYHAGSLENISDYYSWDKYVNGSESVSSVYATTDTTNEAIGQINTTPEPWFGWVAFNAPHRPFHAPPQSLAPSFQLQGNPNATPVEHQKAAIEALDTEIGRLLGSIDADVRSRTTIIFIGDNGSDGGATDFPFDPGQAKGTAFEGGVNVPLIVNGPSVSQPGSETAGLVMGVDLFSTVADLAGIDLKAQGLMLDSKSFHPYFGAPGMASIRDWTFTESFIPNGPGPYIRRWIGARNERFKLTIQLQEIPRFAIQVGFFDLSVDPFEQVNLLGGFGRVPISYTDLIIKIRRMLGSF